MTHYFTFGFDHVHVVGKHVLNKDCVIKITADNPREVMFNLFGGKWSMHYMDKPEMHYFPRGVFDYANACWE